MGLISIATQQPENKGVVDKGLGSENLSLNQNIAAGNSSLENHRSEYLVNNKDVVPSTEVEAGKTEAPAKKASLDFSSSDSKQKEYKDKQVKEAEDLKNGAKKNLDVSEKDLKDNTPGGLGSINVFGSNFWSERSGANEARQKTVDADRKMLEAREKSLKEHENKLAESKKHSNEAKKLYEQGIIDEAKLAMQKASDALEKKGGGSLLIPKIIQRH